MIDKIFKIYSKILIIVGLILIIVFFYFWLSGINNIGKQFNINYNENDMNKLWFIMFFGIGIVIMPFLSNSLIVQGYLISAYEKKKKFFFMAMTVLLIIIEIIKNWLFYKYNFLFLENLFLIHLIVNCVSLLLFFFIGIISEFEEDS